MQNDRIIHKRNSENIILIIFFHKRLKRVDEKIISLNLP